MKLLGVRNKKHVVASISHYDCNGVDGLMADGGQPGTSHYAGYTRMSGERVWFEVPQSFGELFTDYNRPSISTENGFVRKYGIWKIEDVKILDNPEEWPDTKSFEYEVEQTIWGTNGINGDQPTKYVHLVDCDTDHLEAILQLCKDRRNDDYVKIIKYILNKRE